MLHSQDVWLDIAANTLDARFSIAAVHPSGSPGRLNLFLTSSSANASSVSAGIHALNNIFDSDTAVENGMLFYNPNNCSFSCQPPEINQSVVLNLLKIQIRNIYRGQFVEQKIECSD